MLPRRTKHHHASQLQPDQPAHAVEVVNRPNPIILPFEKLFACLMKDKLPKKTICKWDRRTLEDALPLLAQQILDAKYICRKCGRAASEKRLLCKPVKLQSLLPPHDEKTP